MLNLISTWPLKNGCPQELLNVLNAMPAKIIAGEIGAISYAINFPANNPMSEASTLSCTTKADVSEIVFVESYADVSAFKAHLNGPLFTAFREQNLQYFKEDPTKPGWPITQTVFLDPIASQHK